MKSLKISGGWLVAAMLVLLALAGGLTTHADVKAPKQKRYYLTSTTHPADAALSACAAGYHMATLWEIRDTTGLTYNASLGATRADSGSGPAAELFGWIRTGGGASGSTTAGVGNCEAWTSSSPDDSGTIVELNGRWSDPAVNASPWNPASTLCSSSAPVWCVEE